MILTTGGVSAGNPTSALVMFGLLERPYVLRIQGVEDVTPLSFTINVGFAWPKPGSRREYLRARSIPFSELL